MSDRDDPEPPEDAAGRARAPLYRSAITDALGRPIAGEGELRVWVDDDLEDRRAPEGWIHLITAREACFLLLTGRVIELSLDHDIGDEPGEHRFGSGAQVIDFLDEQQGQYGRALWPRDGIVLHTGNSEGREVMTRALRTTARRHGIEVTETLTPGAHRRFGFGGG